MPTCFADSPHHAATSAIRFFITTSLLAVSIMATTSPIQAQSSAAPASDASSTHFDFPHVAALRSVADVAVSPDGSRMAAIVQVPRDLQTADDGAAWAELHVTDADGASVRAFIQGAVNISSPQFTADGRAIAFRAKRGNDKTFGVWLLPVDGGEAHKVLGHKTGIRSFTLSPDGTQIAFTTLAKKDKTHEKAKKKGYDGIVFEEDNRPIELYVADLEAQPAAIAPGTPTTKAEPRRIDIEGSVFDVAWSDDGSHLLVAVAPGPLVDQRYMHKRLRLVRLEDAEVVASIENPGKLGTSALSPDGRHAAMISGADWNDPKDGRLLVSAVDAAAGSSNLRDLFPDLDGHISAFAWRSDDSLVYVADIGVETELGTIDLDGTRRALWTSGPGGPPVVRSFALARDGKTVALRGERPEHPTELFRFDLDAAAEPTRLTHSNPWLTDVTMTPQRVVTWTARDGMELEGLLIEPHRPAGASDGPAPLVMIVHGGPESHVRNGWHNTYSRPSQLLAAHGYAVFHPNYRGSTGRGVAFSKLGQGDAAGPEFDDLVDALDHLIDTGVADRDRIGVTGGSYGGYATAWMSTRHSDRVRAGVMFNGISNKHSKALTTDIPEEDRAVHTLYEPFTRAEYALTRSPISYVGDATTPLLIVHGMADTRVHPSQSLQLYRALKLADKAPVRMIRYPGEPHGNRRQATKEDYTHRLVRWMNHFVLDDATELPPQQIDHAIGHADAEENDASTD